MGRLGDKLGEIWVLGMEMSHPASGLTEDDSSDAERFVATFVKKKKKDLVYILFLRGCCKIK